MNFLAHLYLTQNHDLISVGNFIADAVKGKNSMDNFPDEVRQGVMIHREIDRFTDSHEQFRKGTLRLRDSFGKTAPVIMDIFYDHILAKNWSDFSEEKLHSFIDKKYQLITDHHHLLPEKAKFMFRYMKRDNWLLSYKDISGIESILKRMDKRVPFESNMQGSIKYFKMHEKAFTEEFYLFFEEIRQHISNKIQEI